MPLDPPTSLPVSPPQFAPLAGADWVWLADVARRFPPYSEFSLASVQAWALALSPEIARLPHGVMLRLSDIQTGERFATLLGSADVQRDVHSYLSVAGAAPLRLVPAVVAGGLDRARFEVVPERDHFDYVLDAAAVAGLRGNALKHKRSRANKLLREHAAMASPLEIARPAAAAEIAALYEDWSRAKGNRTRLDHARLRAELNAVGRLIERHGRFRLVATALRIEDRLVGFSLAEMVHDGFAILHFSKSLGRELPGANEALMQATARGLLSEGCRLINMQEDLGLPGLREAKLRYRPVGFLEKFRVALRREEVGG